MEDYVTVGKCMEENKTKMLLSDMSTLVFFVFTDFILFLKMTFVGIKICHLSNR